MTLLNPEGFATRLDEFCDAHADQLPYSEAQLALPIRGKDVSSQENENQPGDESIPDALTAHQEDKGYKATIRAVHTPHPGETDPKKLSATGFEAINLRLQTVLGSMTGKEEAELQWELGENNLSLRPGDRLRRIDIGAGDFSLVEEWLMGTQWARSTRERIGGAKSPWKWLGLKGDYLPTEDLPEIQPHNLLSWIQNYLNDGKLGLLPREVLDAVFLQEDHNLETLYDEMAPDKERPKNIEDLDLKPHDYVLALTWATAEEQAQARQTKSEDTTPMQVLPTPYSEGNWMPQKVTLLQVAQIEDGTVEFRPVNSQEGGTYRLNDTELENGPELWEYPVYSARTEFGTKTFGADPIPRENLRLQMVKIN
jgi:hypothetical protein